MRITSEKRSLPVELTAEELAVESQKLATAVEDVKAQKEHIAEKVGLWKETKKALEGKLAYLEGEMNDLAVIVDTGTAEREVECSWLYSLGSGYAFLVRDDTGDLVHHRKLGDAERQTDLLEVIREPTPEQLASWIETLGLQVDPQQGLPLEEAPIHYYKAIPFADGSRLIGRFTEADHRPSSLDGVHLQTSGDVATGLPEPVNKAELDYETDSGILQDYRRELEDLLAARQAEAIATGREADPAGEPKDEPPPPPRRKGARG